MDARARAASALFRFRPVLVLGNGRHCRRRVGAFPGVLLVAAWLGAEPQDSAAAATFTANTYNFTYSNRAALLADGWSFIATTAAGLPRDTEVITPDAAAVSYDQNAHPGVLRIPPNAGDLWSAYNNTTNTLFRNLSSNWVSVRLDVPSFQPTGDYQQMRLALYQDDDHYVEIGRGFNSAQGGQGIHFVREDGTNTARYSPACVLYTNVSPTAFRLRLDRDLATDAITGYYSLDGVTWVAAGGSSQAFANARLCIWAGSSYSWLPYCDLRRLEIVTSDQPLLPLLVAQPQHLVFNTVAGEPLTNAQQVRVIARRTQAPLEFSVTANVPWILANTTPARASTPGSFDVSVNTAGIPPGTYDRTVTCSAPGAVPASVTVTLIVNPASRVRSSTWRDAKAGAMSIWIDDSQPTAFDALTTNGLRGTYVLCELEPIPAYFTNYYLAGMEIGSHTVTHPCQILAEPRMRFEIETNIAHICALVPQPGNDLISFVCPCGVTTNFMEIVYSDYFLITRSYNLNELEDPTPYDFMNVKSFNGHEHDPHQFNPTAPPNVPDLKTMVDAAVAQGKWFNLVLHTMCNDDGAIPYAVGKDIWVGTGGAVTKYILQRDRTVITNYSEASGLISFDCYRLPLDPSSVRSFETAINAQDVLTFQVDLTGIVWVSGLSVNGAPTPYSFRSAAGKTNLLVNLPVSLNPQRVVLQVTNIPPPPPAPPDPNAAALNISRTPDRRVQLIGVRTPQRTYRVQAATDLVHWTTIATNPAGNNGTVIYVDTTATNYSRRFYRTVSP